MPQAQNFTIKDGSATPADVLFTNVQPAGPNSAPAIYFARAKSAVVAGQPKVQVSSRGKKGLREVHYTLLVPYTVVDGNGAIKVVDSAFADVKVTLPDTVTDAVRSDLAAYLGNVLTNATFKEVNSNGFAPS